MIELKLTDEQAESVVEALEKAYRETLNVRTMKNIGEVLGQLKCQNRGYSWCPISTNQIRKGDK